MDTESALKTLGFRPQDILGAGRGYEYDFGGLVLQAFKGMSRTLQPVWILSGIRSSSRSIEEIVFEVPLSIESVEQAQAWIAFGAFREVASRDLPDWLEVGRRSSHLLPWRRDLEAYEGRPRCEVSRDWLRLAFKTLKSLQESSVATQEWEVMFDGSTLTFRVAGHVVPMPGIGAAWPHAFALSVEYLSELPKRLARPSVQIDVWERHLRIGNRAFPLSTAGL